MKRRSFMVGLLASGIAVNKTFAAARAHGWLAPDLVLTNLTINDSNYGEVLRSATHMTLEGYQARALHMTALLR